MKPATKTPCNFASPIPIVHTRSAPSLLTPSPIVTRFYGLGANESRKQDEDDDTLILQIRSKPLSWKRASQVVGVFNIGPVFPDSIVSKIFNLSMHVPGTVDVDNTEDIHHFTQLHIWAAGHPGFTLYRHMGDSLMLVPDHSQVSPSLRSDSTIGSTTRPAKFGLPALVANICCIAPRLMRLELAADHRVFQALHDSQIDRVEVLWIVSATGAMIGNNGMNSSFPSVRTLIAGSDTEI